MNTTRAGSLPFDTRGLQREAGRGAPSDRVSLYHDRADAPECR